MIRNTIYLTVLFSFINLMGVEYVSLPFVNAMEFNQKQKLHQQLLDNFAHPVVGQEEAVIEEEVQPEEEEEVEEEVWYNNTNLFNYPFNDYKIYEEFRRDFSAFLNGADANYFASNATTCFENAINLIQYDFELLIIKLMYGDLK